MHNHDAVYLYALTQLRGVGAATALRIRTTFATPGELLSAGSEEITARLGTRLGAALVKARNDLPSRIEDATKAMEESLRQGIHVIPVTAEDYPPLLRTIADPPVVLFAKGNTATLSKTRAVAVVGTREPTRGGVEVARRIASKLTQAGYVVVAGLAKGIDTAAHEGALAAGGVTWAVLATPIDRIFPAENKRLAERIRGSGLLLSEYAVGSSTSKRSFVQRDRIQSGLSVAVIPVQTDVVGGTMHTVRFAREQGRLIFCPEPLEREQSMRQYAGIRTLIESSIATIFRGSDYSALLEKLDDHERRLLQDAMAKIDQAVMIESMATSQSDDDIDNDVLAKLRSVAHEYGLERSQHVFDRVIEKLRNQLFPRIGIYAAGYKGHDSAAIETSMPTRTRGEGPGGDH